MASSSASGLLTSLPSSSRCVDNRRVLDSLRGFGFGAANRLSLSCQCGYTGGQLVSRVNGLLSGDGCQGLREGASRECCSGYSERGLMCRPAVEGVRRSRKGGVARASFNVAYEFEDAFSALSLPAFPEPVLFPRKMLNLKFAVLLMRSAYEAVDALDFIPMDKFQIKFWKLRQSEVEPYTLQCRPLRVKYGDLTDPLYFDFISFSQFAAISNEMKTGEVVFQEKVGSDGESRTVRRDERLKDNATLPAAFINKAGDLLYEKLIDGFEGEVFNAPPPASSDFLAVTDGVKKLVQVFVDRGYALKSSVEPVQFSPNQPGGKLRVKLEGSATQWGVRALASRRALLLNDFAALAVGAYLRACGFSASPKVRYTDTSTEQLWTLV
ncbi:hypothetical protein M758_11G137500 [Ceratodon purpureus]|nr:hypothetical protein M758_11G137500 [Ceratodon purpureus]